MFDFANTRPVGGKTIVDQTLLDNALAALSDEDLNQLEDELNFARFAGLPSARILAMLDELMELDAAWKAQLTRQTANAA